jgi:hypothetical protein
MRDLKENCAAFTPGAKLLLKLRKMSQMVSAWAIYGKLARLTS